MDWSVIWGEGRDAGVETETDVEGVGTELTVGEGLVGKLERKANQ